MNKDEKAAAVKALQLKRTELERERRDFLKKIEAVDYEIAEIMRGKDRYKEGWYLDGDGLICKVERDGTMHDGWGNSGPEFGPFSTPMTRLYTMRQARAEIAKTNT